MCPPVLWKPPGLEHVCSCTTRVCLRAGEQLLPSEHRNTPAASDKPRSCSAPSQVSLTNLRQLRAPSRPTLSRKHSFYPPEISFSSIFCLMLPNSFRTTTFAVMFSPSLVQHFKEFNYASNVSLSLKSCWQCPCGCPWLFLSTCSPNWWGDKTTQRKSWRCKGTSAAQEGQEGHKTVSSSLLHSN